MSDILYICDRKACKRCNPECHHTTDINHAYNFEKECLHRDIISFIELPTSNEDLLPPNVGKHECQRKDGSYGYVCNACGYPVGDHDGYCSECGARVAGTLFYYGNQFKLAMENCI